MIKKIYKKINKKICFVLNCLGILMKGIPEHSYKERTVIKYGKKYGGGGTC